VLLAREQVSQASPAQLKKFPTGDRLTVRKTDAPAAGRVWYEVLYHPSEGLTGELGGRADNGFCPYTSLIKAAFMGGFSS
jgi:hypothetical protein